MSDQTIIIRNYSPKDFVKLVRFRSEVARFEETNEQVPLQDPIENIARPGHFPEKNLFIAEKAGDISGYVDVMPELKIGRVILNTLVHSGCRKRGLTEKLIARAIERAKGLSAERIQVNIGQNDATAAELYSKMGFTFVRRFLQLGLDLSNCDLPKANRGSHRCRFLYQGEEDKLRKIQNCSFLNTWGFNPNTTEDICYQIGLPNATPEDIILCSEGDKPTAYCWTIINVVETKGAKGLRGRIHMLGVDPDYRGRGLGKHVLLAGLVNLKSKGIRIVDLTVDSESHIARALYESFGFAVRTSSVWYEKKLS